jgi:hypothetical protein
MCVLHNPYVHPNENYICPSCHPVGDDSLQVNLTEKIVNDYAKRKARSKYTFVVGEDFPIPMSDISACLNEEENIGLCADSLPENSISQFIEEKVRQRMISTDYPNAEKTITVRMISNCERYFKVPEVIRKHFRLKASTYNAAVILPPSRVLYRSKAITLFQKFDGIDVCIFCMYVQEYDGDDEFDTEQDKELAVQEKRVYIAYLDSVEHFRPRTLRTAVYQEVLTAYLATARLRGYEAAHIWACPPSRGNSFVFWNHPSAQRTPNVDRLTSWYHVALSRAIDCGVVTNVQSLYESNFTEPIHLVDVNTNNSIDCNLKMPCPPLLEGDFWIEEALRIHSATFARLLKEYANPMSEITLKADNMNATCAAMQIVTMFREKIMNLPLAKAFRRPVNAAAMKLTDYHSIISKPMDLGSVLSRCVLGEYETLRDMVSDVQLVFANAKKFNPPGHIIHANAIELEEIFINELNATTKTWIDPMSGEIMQHSWEKFKSVKIGLCQALDNCNCTARIIDNAAASNEPQKEGDVKYDVSYTDNQTAKSRNGILDGPEAVRQRMIGNDVWLLEKKAALSPKVVGKSKGFKRDRKSCTDTADEPAFKRRRQTWLGEEVGTAVRRMRTSFFKCSLSHHGNELGSKSMAADTFRAYSSEYVGGKEESTLSSRVADARHAFLEVSQFRGLEFDTLRRAKYSSAILLYHLHYDGAPGLIPECTTCGKEIEGVRWHRICKVHETRPPSTSLHSGRKPKSTIPFQTEELCSSCFSEQPNQQQFIPLQVSL